MPRFLDPEIPRFPDPGIPRFPDPGIPRFPDPGIPRFPDPGIPRFLLKRKVRTLEFHKPYQFSCSIFPGSRIPGFQVAVSVSSFLKDLYSRQN